MLFFAPKLYNYTMLAKRIIPCLDIKNGRVVKGVKFKGVREVGDPVKLARKYNDDGADELCFLDIMASFESRKIIIDLVEQVSSQIFIPFSVGGGINSIENIRNVLLAGADKVSMCTGALKNPDLIREASEIFGSQSIVLSIDAKKVGNRWHAFSHGGRYDTGIDAVEWAVKGEKLGAGEILLNSIDADGTQSGYDIELTRAVSDSVGIPVIASGGAGTLEQIYEVFDKGHADAALVASIVHFGTYSIKDIKKFLKEKGVAIRWSYPQ